MPIANCQFSVAPLAAALLLAGATAQAGAPAEEVQWIGSKAISYDAELRYEYENHDRVEKDTGDRTRFTNLRTAEIINLHWSGHVYHPRFLQLTTTFGFLVEQVSARLDEPGLKRTTRHNDISPQYSIRGIFLPQHPVSLVFDLERHRASAASGFGQVAIADTQSERADVFYKGDPLAGQVYGSISPTRSNWRATTRSATPRTRSARPTSSSPASRSASATSSSTACSRTSRPTPRKRPPTARPATSRAPP